MKLPAGEPGDKRSLLQELAVNTIDRGDGSCLVAFAIALWWVVDTDDVKELRVGPVLHVYGRHGSRQCSQVSVSGATMVDDVSI